VSLEVVERAAERIRTAIPQIAVFENEAPDRVEGTGTTVVEVRDGGPWGPTQNNARHRVVQVNVVSDCSRDDEGLPTRDDADRRAWIVWESLDAVLHDVDQAWRHEWSAVHTSRRADGPVLTLVPNGDGSVMLSARYEISHD
jgi:hypothetical protein